MNKTKARITKGKGNAKRRICLVLVIY
jgi:hypothetical protein